MCYRTLTHLVDAIKDAKLKGDGAFFDADEILDLSELLYDILVDYDTFGVLPTREEAEVNNGQ